MLDEDSVTLEDLMVKHKICVAYVEGSGIALPYWEANVYQKGRLVASSTGRTLAGAIESIICILPQD